MSIFVVFSSCISKNSLPVILAIVLEIAVYIHIVCHLVILPTFISLNRWLFEASGNVAYASLSRYDCGYGFSRLSVQIENDFSHLYQMWVLINVCAWIYNIFGVHPWFSSGSDPTFDYQLLPPLVQCQYIFLLLQTKLVCQRLSCP